MTRDLSADDQTVTWQRATSAGRTHTVAHLNKQSCVQLNMSKRLVWPGFSWLPRGSGTGTWSCFCAPHLELPGEDSGTFTLFTGTIWAVELAVSWLDIFCLRLWMTHIFLASLNVRLVSFPWSSKASLLHLLLSAQTRYRQNNEAPHTAPLPGTDDLYFAPYVAAVRVLSSSSVSSSDQDRVGGAVRNPRTRLRLEKPHLSLLQSDLHHSWHRTSGKLSASYSKWSRKSISVIVTLNTANKLPCLQHKQNTGVWKEEQNCNR